MNFIRNVFMALLFLSLFLWVNVKGCYHSLVTESDLASHQVEVVDTNWTPVGQYARDGMMFDITARLRNKSDLVLRRVHANYMVYDCPNATSLRSDCVILGSDEGSVDLDAAPGCPALYTDRLTLVSMANARDVLVVDVNFTEFTGDEV